MNAATLLLETSGRGGFVGLADTNGIVQTGTLDEARKHARDLAETVRQIHSASSRTPRDIASVFVSIGPGSYTGLHVGLASAKAFAYAVGCPLVAVPTFATIVEVLPRSIQRVDVIADGLQGLVYAQRFHRVAGDWCAANELRIVPAADWCATLTAADSVAGPGLVAHDSIIPKQIPRVAEEHRQPALEGLWIAGRKMAPLTREDLFRVEPLYLRGSSAEEKRKAQSEPVSASSAS